MKIQRTFILDDEWCYFKIYIGFKTADAVLTNIIYPVSQLLLQNNIIDKWFFIRYLDPKFHLRIRFHVTDTQKIPIIVMNFYRSIKSYIDDELIWKVQTDTYNRELERYGTENIELSETLFFYDSEMIVKELTLLKTHLDEDLQWLLALKMMDSLLEDFGFSLPEKYTLLQTMQDNFKKEFGINEVYKRQFGQKYREKRMLIEKILNMDFEHDKGMSNFFVPIFEKSAVIKDVVQKIKEKIIKNETISLDNLIQSYIHMMVNRFFRTQQRTCELVLYDYLFRYYTSQKARIDKVGKVDKIGEIVENR